jgi:hypothetical protein
MSYHTIVLLLLTLSSQVTAAEQSPYTDAAGHAIKALSPQQIENLRDGKGMGLALAAELNAYPGPKHVLELADELDLTDGQRDASRKLLDAMQQQAQTIGAELINAERTLDRLFANAEAESVLLKAALQHIGRLRAELRFAHLDAHIRQRELLDDEQVKRYIHLRGYNGRQGHSSHGH